MGKRCEIATTIKDSRHSHRTCGESYRSLIFLLPVQSTHLLVCCHPKRIYSNLILSLIEMLKYFQYPYIVSMIHDHYYDYYLLLGTHLTFWISIVQEEKVSSNTITGVYVKGNTLTLRRITSAHSGSYWCEAWNSIGRNHSQHVTIDVIRKLIWSQHHLQISSKKYCSFLVSVLK